MRSELRVTLLRFKRNSLSGLPELTERRHCWRYSVFCGMNLKPFSEL